MESALVRLFAFWCFNLPAVLRADWSDQTPVLLLKSGPAEAHVGHAQYDNGHISIYHHGYSASDAG